jgi:hypothetical protein
MNRRRCLMFRRLSVLAIVAAGLLASCAYPEIVSQTPGGLEIECAKGITCRSSRREIDAMAQDHCHEYGQDARWDSISSSAMGKQWATYTCVPAGTAGVFVPGTPITPIQ